jgi:hypothetical protein
MSIRRLGRVLFSGRSQMLALPEGLTGFSDGTIQKSLWEGRIFWVFGGN